MFKIKTLIDPEECDCCGGTLGSCHCILEEENARFADYNDLE